MTRGRLIWLFFFGCLLVLHTTSFAAESLKANKTTPAAQLKATPQPSAPGTKSPAAIQSSNAVGTPPPVIGTAGRSPAPAVGHEMGKPGIENPLDRKIGGAMGAVPGKMEMPPQGVGAAQQGGRSTPGSMGIPGRPDGGNNGGNSGGISMPGQNGGGNNRGSSGGLSMPGQRGDSNRHGGSSGGISMPGQNGGGNSRGGNSSGLGMPGQGGNSEGNRGGGMPGRNGGETMEGGGDKPVGFFIGAPQAVPGGNSQWVSKPKPNDNVGSSGTSPWGRPEPATEGVDWGDKKPEPQDNKDKGYKGPGDKAPADKDKGDKGPGDKGPGDEPDKGGKPDKEISGMPSESGTSGSGGGNSRPSGPVGGSIVNPGRGDSGGTNTGGSRLVQGNNPVTNPTDSPVGNRGSAPGGIGRIAQPGLGDPQRP